MCYDADLQAELRAEGDALNEILDRIEAAKAAGIQGYTVEVTHDDAEPEVFEIKGTIVEAAAAGRERCNEGSVYRVLVADESDLHNGFRQVARGTCWGAM